MTDPTADEVRRLRAEEGLSVREIRARTGLGRNRVYELLRGVPPPRWTRRPNAKDELRTQALALRGQGCAVPEIAARLGVSRSTAYQWVKHLPLDRDESGVIPRTRSTAASDARWAAHREARDAAQRQVHREMAARVGPLNERDLLLLGAALYWCEGSKSKPWRRHDHVQFVNSDPGLLALFLRFLESCGVSRSLPSYRVTIHESADVDGAVRWWVDTLGVPPQRFRRPTLKRHNPTTLRRNTGDGYHGCLVIDVPRSRELYWRIEGMIAELFRIVDSAGSQIYGP
ncbi:helix-turn-helix domain-containing protein [Micromonospora sp. KC213]|uniref:helix-turn-helix domain-containing protein n=1 Tax=Micromonospora sp. KC213 TaxID=2530378 RepID=UPI00105269D5|nr:helix-turn-helix domain-containing protein [Micromonospora sp. KC213]TDC35393.1 resolvase [Micromonospora sp. KC213]